MKLKKYFASLIHFFYPPLCFVCKEALLNQEKYICTACLCKAPIIRAEMQHHIETLFWGIIPIQRSSTLWYYNKGSDYAHLIHAIKYENQPLLAQYLGEMLANQELKSLFFNDIDFIVPIPVHKDRLKQRGYNQAEQIAVGINLATNIPIDTTSIIKETATQSQTSKSGYERHLNPLKSFKVTDHSKFINKHILLVDDVITTGATIMACAEELLDTPGIKISIMSICASK